MTRIQKCDKCGKKSTTSSESNWVYGNLENRDLTLDKIGQFDLCPACAPTFIKFAKQFFTVKKQKN